jgi:uncharacterized protein (DUF433 family)
MAKATKALVIPDELVMNKIYLVRGQKVMFDFDLASLYGVETRVLNQAVKRNAGRFPGDFMFRLSEKEWEALRLQIVMSPGEDNSSQNVMSSNGLNRNRLHRCNKNGKFEIMQDKVIHIDPEILGGTPVFYGTRVPIKNLFDYLETGETIETFLQDFDSVSREQVLKVLELSEQLIQSSSSILHENIT